MSEKLEELQKKNTWLSEGHSEFRQPAPRIGVVITTHKRPLQLLQAVTSVQVAGCFDEVVITATSVNAETRKVLKEAKRILPRVRVISRADDPGNNQAWLDGVKALTTQYCLLLHDDDLVLPGFHKIKKELVGLPTLVCWDAKAHGDRVENRFRIFPELEHGDYSSYDLLQFILNRPRSVSPINGLFKRSLVINALKDSESLPKKCWTNDTMLVGNDLAIWFHACSAGGEAKYIKEKLVSYGHHPGSHTCMDMNNKANKFPAMYDEAKEFLVEGGRRIFHAVEFHEPATQEEKARNALARRSWYKLYNTGLVVPCWLSEYPRTGSGKRKLPFLHDVVKKAFEKTAFDTDLVMLTNMDTVLHPMCIGEIFSTADRTEAFFCFRRNFEKLPMLSYKKPSPEDGFYDGGRDFFVFSSRLTPRILHKTPDYLLGANEWDHVLAMVIRELNGVHTDHTNVQYPHPNTDMETGYVLHEYHEAFWHGGKADKDKDQKHNYKLTDEWCKEYGYEHLHPRKPKQ